MTGKFPAYNAIDLFCGAGGTSIGFKRCGFNIALGVDIDEHALSSFNGYFGDNKGKKIDMFTATGADLLQCANLKKEDVTVLIGCPPCQGYSRLNTKAEDDDPRNALVEKFGSIVDQINPLFVTFENVPGVMKKGNFYKKMIQILKNNNYSIAEEIVDMREFGIPQRRKRVVVVGCKDKEIFSRFSHPMPTHAEKEDNDRRAYVSVKSALSGLPKIGAGESDPNVKNHKSMNHSERIMERIKAIPPDGGSLKNADSKHHYKCHEKENRGYNDVFGRLSWNSPSTTITTGCYNPTKGRFLHPDQDRAISLREAARLQTFPDDFVFEGGMISVARQIGNAFPPRYAELLAKAILDAIKDGSSNL